MKKQYNTPEIDVEIFETNDILTDSRFEDSGNLEDF